MVNKKFRPTLPSVFVKDGELFLITPDGNTITAGMTDIKLVEKVGEITTLEVKFLVNVVDSETEALAQYVFDKIETLQTLQKCNTRPNSK